MKWIKADDYVPENPSRKHWRDEITKKPISWRTASKYAISEDKSDLVEWLDESGIDNEIKKDERIKELEDFISEVAEFNADANPIRIIKKARRIIR